VSIQLSTSQAVALTTGFAAALAFAAYYKAALAHPSRRWRSTCPRLKRKGARGAAPKDVDDEDDEDDDAEKKERAARRRAR
jgi:hypothetical protein